MTKSVQELKGIELNSNNKNENRELENISNDKDKVDISNEYTQRSRDHSYSINFIDEENKKNIFRIGRTDKCACKGCNFKGDKWYMFYIIVK